MGNAKMGSSRVWKRWAEDSGEDVTRQGSAGGVAGEDLTVSEGTQRWKEEGSG